MDVLSYKQRSRRNFSLNLSQLFFLLGIVNIGRSVWGRRRLLNWANKRNHIFIQNSTGHRMG